MPGSSVTFTFWRNLAEATSAINETADLDAVATDTAQVSVTLYEYGQVTVTTEKLRVLSLVNVDSAQAKLVGFSMGTNIDKIARAAFVNASKIRYGYTDSAFSVAAAADSSLNSYSVMRADLIEKAAADLRTENCPPLDGANYVCIAHPHQIYDLRVQTGSGAWRAPKEYADPANIYNGEVGLLAGCRFVVTSNAYVEDGGGSSNYDLYRAVVIGQQAVAKGVGVAPEVRITSNLDKLGRWAYVGWYALLGYGAFRTATAGGYVGHSLVEIHTTSTLGSNA